MPKVSIMDKTKIKRKYEIAIGLLFIACVAATLYTYNSPNIFVIVLFPAIACGTATLLYLALARIFFTKQPERLLKPSFKKPIRQAIFMPVANFLLILLLAMPQTPHAQSVMSDETLTVIAYAVILFILPICTISTVVFMALSFVNALRHRQIAGVNESSAYRNGPLVLVCVMHMIMFLVVIVSILMMIQG